MTSEAAPLPARPFNHLSVLAYLAIGIVVLASSLVTAYLIHSCYRSATRNDANRGTIVDPESGSVDEVYRQETSRRELELSPLAREFYQDEESFLSDSRTVIGKRSDSSFDKHVFVSPPPPHLRYPSDSTVAVHIPSPSSPSPALKKQNRSYARQISYSPVSPSPSFFSPPCNLSPYDERDRYIELGINSNAKRTKRRAPRPGTQFDSNNIRYISPLEPCVADSTVKLYKEPKLSPVHGSVIPPSPGDGLLCPSYGTQPSFSRDRHAKLSSISSTPTSMPPQRGRVLSGPATDRPRLPDPRGRKESINPISSQWVGLHSWEPTLPIVHLKPGPGYF